MQFKGKMFYKIYDLQVVSEIPFLELQQISYINEELPVCTIRYGEMPQQIQEEIQRGKWHDFNKGDVWFYIPHTATYWVRDGKSIIIQIEGDADIESIKTFTLGSALGIVLIQRNQVAIHGSSIAKMGRGIIVTGESGVGKSTLAARLVRRGYDFLADDVSVVGRNAQLENIILPAYPQQKLCKNSLEIMKMRSENYHLLDEERQKFAVPVNEDFIQRPVLLVGICEIEIGEENKVIVEEMTGSRKLRLLLENIYRRQLFQYIEMEKAYFMQCIHITQRVPIIRLIRPKGSFTLDDQQAVIEQYFMNQEKEA